MNWKYNRIEKTVPISDAIDVVHIIHDTLQEAFKSIPLGLFTPKTQRQIDGIVGTHIKRFKQRDMLYDLQSSWEINHKGNNIALLILDVFPISYATGTRQIGPSSRLTATFAM